MVAIAPNLPAAVTLSAFSVAVSHPLPMWNLDDLFWTPGILLAGNLVCSIVINNLKTWKLS